jgi:hypothetical protein
MAEMKIATFNVEWMTALFGAMHNDWDGTIPRTPGQIAGFAREISFSEL